MPLLTAATALDWGEGVEVLSGVTYIVAILQQIVFRNVKN